MIYAVIALVVLVAVLVWAVYRQGQSQATSQSEAASEAKQAAEQATVADLNKTYAQNEADQPSWDALKEKIERDPLSF